MNQKRAVVLGDNKNVICNWKQARLRTTLSCIFLFLLAAVSFTSLFSKIREYSFEPDTPEVVETSKSFQRFFENPFSGNLPEAPGRSTYFDGPHITFAMTAVMLNGFSGKMLAGHGITPENDSLMIFSIRYSNMILWSLSVVFVFLILLLLSGRWYTSFFITLLYFAFSREILSVNNMRVDFFLLLSGLMVLYAAIKIIKGADHILLYLFFAIAVSLSVATKATTPFYISIPSVILTFFLATKAQRKKLVLLTVPVVGMLMMLLFFRWWLYLPKIPDYLNYILNDGRIWLGTLSGSLWFYFFQQFIILNADPAVIEKFSTTGSKFFMQPALLLQYPLSSFISVLVILMIYTGILRSLWYVLRRRDKLQLFLLLMLLCYIIILAVGPAIARYGIFVPVFAACFLVLQAERIIEYYRGVAAKILAVLMLGILSSYFVLQIKNFNVQNEAVAKTDFSNSITRIAARKWLEKEVKPGARLMLYLTQPVWNPPLQGLDFSVTENVLDKSLAAAGGNPLVYPPDRRELESRYDLIIFNSNIFNTHLSQLKALREHELYNSRKMKFEELQDKMPVNYVSTLSYDSLSRIAGSQVLDLMWEENKCFDQAMFDVLMLKYVQDSTDAACITSLFSESCRFRHDLMDFRSLVTTHGAEYHVDAWLSFFRSLDRHYYSVSFSGGTRGSTTLEWIKIYVIQQDALVKNDVQ